MMKCFAALSILALVVSGCGRSPAPDASSTSDRDEILRAVLQDVVSNPALKGTRAFYGSPGDGKLALVSNSHYGIPWSRRFDPALKEYSVVFVSENDDKRDRSKPHLLGVRLDRIDLSDLSKKSRGVWLNAPIAVTIMNAGGNGPGGATIMGGCGVYYVPKKEGGKWIAEYVGSYDP